MSGVAKRGGGARGTIVGGAPRHLERAITTEESIVRHSSQPAAPRPGAKHSRGQRATPNTGLPTSCGPTIRTRATADGSQAATRFQVARRRSSLRTAARAAATTFAEPTAALPKRNRLVSRRVWVQLVQFGSETVRYEQSPNYKISQNCFIIK